MPQPQNLSWSEAGALLGVVVALLTAIGSLIVATSERKKKLTEAEQTEQAAAATQQAAMLALVDPLQKRLVEVQRELDVSRSEGSMRMDTLRSQLVAANARINELQCRVEALEKERDFLRQGVEILSKQLGANNIVPAFRLPDEKTQS